MEMNKVEKLKEVVDWLERNNYIYVLNNKYYLSNQVNRDLNLVAEPLGLSSPIRFTEIDESLYKRYIEESGVPSRISRGDGSSYYANRYSNEAAREFTRVIRSGHSFDILVESTRRYYKNGGKKTISNYIVEGIWQTGYDEVVKGANGTKNIPGGEDHRRLL